MHEQRIAEFLQWLPSKFEDFQNKSLEEITQTLNELYDTTEGQQTIETLWNTFNEEYQSPEETTQFKNGGKLDYLVQLHKKGGTIKTCDCGCAQHRVFENGGIIEKCACGCKTKVMKAQKGSKVNNEGAGKQYIGQDSYGFTQYPTQTNHIFERNVNSKTGSITDLLTNTRDGGFYERIITPQNDTIYYNNTPSATGRVAPDPSLKNKFNQVLRQNTTYGQGRKNWITLDEERIKMRTPEKKEEGGLLPDEKSKDNSLLKRLREAVAVSMINQYQEGGTVDKSRGQRRWRDYNFWPNWRDDVNGRMTREYMPNDKKIVQEAKVRSNGQITTREINLENGVPRDTTYMQPNGLTFNRQRAIRGGFNPRTGTAHKTPSQQERNRLADDQDQRFSQYFPIGQNNFK